MHERFVIDALVGLGTLRIAVEHEHLPERLRTNHGDVLEGRPPREIRLFDRVVMLLGRREAFHVPLPTFGFGHRRALN